MARVAAYQAPLLPVGSMTAIELIAERVRWCEANGVAILCCPEAVLGGLADQAERPADLALSIATGELARMLQPLMSATVTTIVGFTELGADGLLYNSAAVLQLGAVAGVYRKRHPAIHRSVYQPGDTTPAFTAAGVTFGVIICNDSNYPALGRDVAALGATILFIPSNNALPMAKADVVAASRNIDIGLAEANRLLVVRADVAGRQGDRVALGSSAIVGPRGEVRQSGAQFESGLLVADAEGERDERLVQRVGAGG